MALCAVALIVPISSVAACLDYSPALVSVVGKLERRTYPGRPNYESVARGDEAETGFYLILRTGVCTNGVVGAGETEPKANVKLVQLILDQAGYDALRPRLGTTIRVEGKLFGQISGHHHAPLLLEVAR